MIVNQLFDVCPKFGFTVSPDYAVDIVEVASGVEYRNQLWVNARRTATVTIGPDPGLNASVEYVINFYHAMGGKTIGFLALDTSDYIAIDQPLVIAEGISTEAWQLLKRYTVGPVSADRSITRPASPIVLKDNGTTKTEGVHYTVDYSTGLVSLSFTPIGTLTWSGTFYIPVRFDSDLPVEILEARLLTVNFTLKEIRNEEDEGDS